MGWPQPRFTTARSGRHTRQSNVNARPPLSTNGGFLSHRAYTMSETDGVVRPGRASTRREAG